MSPSAGFPSFAASFRTLLTHLGHDRRSPAKVILDVAIPVVAIGAATLLSTAPLLLAFLLFQKQFVQSFMRAGIR